MKSLQFSFQFLVKDPETNCYDTLFNKFFVQWKGTFNKYIKLLGKPRDEQTLSKPVQHMFKLLSTITKPLTSESQAAVDEVRRA
jgi:hypothetical protein